MTLFHPTIHEIIFDIKMIFISYTYNFLLTKEVCSILVAIVIPFSTSLVNAKEVFFSLMVIRFSCVPVFKSPRCSICPNPTVRSRSSRNSFTSNMTLIFLTHVSKNFILRNIHDRSKVSFIVFSNVFAEF